MTFPLCPVFSAAKPDASFAQREGGPGGPGNRRGPPPDRPAGTDGWHLGVANRHTTCSLTRQWTPRLPDPRCSALQKTSSASRPGPPPWSLPRSRPMTAASTEAQAQTIFQRSRPCRLNQSFIGTVDNYRHKFFRSRSVFLLPRRDRALTASSTMFRIGTGRVISTPSRPMGTACQCYIVLEYPAPSSRPTPISIFPPPLIIPGRL